MPRSNSQDWAGLLKWGVIGIVAFYVISSISGLLGGGSGGFNPFGIFGGGSNTSGNGNSPIPDPYRPLFPGLRIPRSVTESFYRIVSWIPVFGAPLGVVSGAAVAGVPGALVGGTAGYFVSEYNAFVSPSTSPASLIGFTQGYGISYPIYKAYQFYQETHKPPPVLVPQSHTQGGWARNPDGSPYAASGTVTQNHPLNPIHRPRQYRGRWN